jgi:serine/threonine-protein kinase
MEGEDLLDLAGFRVGSRVADRYKVLSQTNSHALPYCSCKAHDCERQIDVHLDILLKHSRPAVAYRREFAALNRLDHPLIVKAFDFFEDEKAVIFATEWLDARSLNYVRRVRSIECDEAIVLIRELALAIAFAHRNDVCHLALNPACCFINHCRSSDDDYRLKLRGFDFSVERRNSDPIGNINVFLSELNYAAPETYSPTTRVGKWSDIYSFGIIAFELFAGRLPFNCSVPHELMLLHRHEPTPSLAAFRRVPDWTNNLIQMCMQKEIDRRPTAAEVLELVSSPDKKTAKRGLTQSLRSMLAKH